MHSLIERQTQRKGEFERKIYIDFLRAIVYVPNALSEPNATIAVVFYHAGGGGNHIVNSVIKISLNWCVPFFYYDNRSTVS